MTVINDLPVGEIVRESKSLYNNQVIDWIIIDKNHEGYPTDSVTLLTKDTIPVPDGYSITPNYENGNLREWLNNIFLGSLSKDMQKALLVTDIISDSAILKDKLYLLSSIETGLSSISENEGVTFDYLKIQSNRVSNKSWWTRTFFNPWFRLVVSNGGYDYSYFSRIYGELRIACNIPQSTPIDKNNNLIFPHPEFLIQQNSKYYSIKSNFYSIGQPTDNTQLGNWYNKYGTDDVNIITQTLNNKEIPMSKNENDIWKTDFELDANEIIDSIDMVDTDENNKSIKYGCNDYKIFDLLDDEFDIMMAK